MLLRTGHNPDVLTCLANLSNDEVFTPPSIANQMLDMLPEEIWKDETVTFLDPACKSGVFLREITKRLIVGLEPKIPKLEDRIEHIFSKQIFGVSITELTALLSRRSVYCSKQVNGKYSLFSGSLSEEGNIKFEKIPHVWKNKKCIYCGASEVTFNRGDIFESHAYEFIHTDKPEEIFNMKFDVIVGNPPYQLNDGGGMGTSATPLYQKFVEQAKKLNPRYLTMIIPARWYAGGKGLDEFRDAMLNDNRIERLVDFFDSTFCFPGVDISGGVCYFLWSKDYRGECLVKTIAANSQNELRRPLLEENCDSFVRFNEAISIVRKISDFNEPKFSELVSARKPFGFSNPDNSKPEPSDGSVKIYAYPKTVYSTPDIISQNVEYLNQFKVFISKAYGERGAFPYNVLAKPFLGEPNSCCSETYLMIPANGSEEISKNLMGYVSTRFFRFLVLLRKNTQNAPRSVYSFVPQQDFSIRWTDEKLYSKYKLSSDEIDFIVTMVKPMEIENGE